jgi:hypothetical protein
MHAWPGDQPQVGCSGLAAERAHRADGPAVLGRLAFIRQAQAAGLIRTRDQLVVLAARATAQDGTDCRGYCSIIVS